MGTRGLNLPAGQMGGPPAMDDGTKSEIWDLAAGTFIAVSVVSGMTYIIAAAIH